MASIPLNLYDTFRRGQFEGTQIDFETPGGNGIKAAFVTSVYTPNQNLHDFWADAEANEVSGTGYVAGGNVMSNGTVTVDGAGVVTVDLDDPATWTQDASGFADARRVILYHDTGTAATSPVIGYSDAFASDQGNVNGDIFISIAATGLITSAR